MSSIKYERTCSTCAEVLSALIFQHYKFRQVTFLSLSVISSVQRAKNIQTIMLSDEACAAPRVCPKSVSTEGRPSTSNWNPEHADNAEPFVPPTWERQLTTHSIPSEASLHSKTRVGKSRNDSQVSKRNYEAFRQRKKYFSSLKPQELSKCEMKRSRDNRLPQQQKGQPDFDLATFKSWPTRNGRYSYTRCLGFGAYAVVAEAYDNQVLLLPAFSAK